MCKNIMKRKWQHDRGLEARMLVFVSIFMLIQYFFSDKLVFMTLGAKIVSESEEPELHQMISRLCAMADLPKPKIAS